MSRKSMPVFSHSDILTTFVLLCLYCTIDSFDAGIIGIMVAAKNISTAIRAYSTAPGVTLAEMPVLLTNSRNPSDTPRNLHISRPSSGAKMRVAAPRMPASRAYIPNICNELAPLLLNTAISFFSCSTFSLDTMNR